MTKCFGNLFVLPLILFPPRGWPISLVLVWLSRYKRPFLSLTPPIRIVSPNYEGTFNRHLSQSSFNAPHPPFPKNIVPLCYLLGSSCIFFSFPPIVRFLFLLLNSFSPSVFPAHISSVLLPKVPNSCLLFFRWLMVGYIRCFLFDCVFSVYFKYRGPPPTHPKTPLHHCPGATTAPLSFPPLYRIFPLPFYLLFPIAFFLIFLRTQGSPHQVSPPSTRNPPNPSLLFRAILPKRSLSFPFFARFSSPFLPFVFVCPLRDRLPFTMLLYNSQLFVFPVLPLVSEG